MDGSIFAKFDVTPPVGRKFKAAIVVRDGAIEVRSTRNGKWATDDQLHYADLMMPEFELAEWDIRKINGQTLDFDPNQPRAPKGTDIGGQWVEAGGGGISTTGSGSGTGASGAEGEAKSSQRFRRNDPSDADRERGIKSIYTAEDGKTFVELEPDNALKFHDAISTAKGKSEFGASVTVYDVDEYRKDRLFLNEEGDAGFALRGDDIISVFKDPDNTTRGVAKDMVRLAVEQGGRRLDAFDTQLPSIYDDVGFRAVARIEFDPQYAPEGWDYETYKDFNNGRPDVVFMVYDPDYGKDYMAGDGKLVGSYDEAVAFQKSEIRPVSGALKGSKSLHPGTVASAKVTGKGGDTDRYEQPSLDKIVSEPKVRDKMATLLDNPDAYPNLRPEDFGTPDETLRNFVDHQKANLRFLWESYDPELREQSTEWYDGARRIVDEVRQKYPDLDDASVSGVLAALSPQKDWNQNVYLGERLIEIYKTQQNTPWSPEMDTQGERMFRPKTGKTTATKAANAAVREAAYESIRGRTLGELETPAQKAMWMQAYDHAHGNGLQYQYVLPNGDRGEVATTAAGRPAIAVWQNTAATADAIMALESRGDRTVLSEVLGDKHKVRSFYNNILDPHSANGDVTIDTHAVGAALLDDHGGSTTAVLHTLASSPLSAKRPMGWSGGAPTSRASGTQGSYGLYATAYRELAEELGIEPRQLQSATWEAKRRLFSGRINKDGQPHGDITKATKQAIHQAWQTYRQGGASLAVTQARIMSLVGAEEKGFKWRKQQDK